MSSSRVSPALWAGGVAAGAWVASGAVNHYLLAVRGLSHPHLVNAVFPATFGRSPALGEFGVAQTVLGTFLVTLAVGICAWLGSRRLEPGGARTALFAGTWLGAVLAATLASALIATGESMQIASTPAAAFQTEWPWATVISAGYWGVLAGWLPALTAVLVTPGRRRADAAGPTAERRDAAQRDAARPGSARAHAPLLVALSTLVIVSVALSLVAYGAESAAYASSHAGGAAVGTNSPAPSATTLPTPIASRTPVPGAQADPHRCAADQLLLTVGPVEAALGHRALTVYARNTGDAACDVFGYPGLTFSSATKPVDIVLSPGTSYMASDPGAQKFSLAPNASARAVLSWGAMAVAADPDAVARVHIASVVGGSAVSFDLSLELAAGGEATVSAWQPAR